MSFLEGVKNIFNRKNTIYTSKTCNDCQKAEKFFSENDVDIEIKRIEEEKNRNELEKRSGKVLVPTIFINGNKYIGFEMNREKIEKEMDLL